MSSRPVSLPTATDGAVRRVVGSLRRIVGSLSHLGDGIRRLAFWAGVLLPVAYVPLLAASPQPDVPALAVVIALHAICLFVGHDHAQ